MNIWIATLLLYIIERLLWIMRWIDWAKDIYAFTHLFYNYTFHHSNKSPIFVINCDPLPLILIHNACGCSNSQSLIVVGQINAWPILVWILLLNIYSSPIGHLAIDKIYIAYFQCISRSMIWFYKKITC